MRFTQFLQKKTGSIEIALLLIALAGIFLNNTGRTGGMIFIFFSLVALVVLYISLAFLSSKRSERIKSERQTGTAGYLVLAALVGGIILTIKNMDIAQVYVHIAMIAAIIMILIVQIRKFKMDVISHPTTLLLYRLIIFWILSFVVHYFLPYILLAG
jgi:hypothetical protein